MRKTLERRPAKYHVEQHAQPILIFKFAELVDVPLPDFMTSANLELMLLASFLFFLVGAIAAVWRSDDSVTLANWAAWS